MKPKICIIAVISVFYFSSHAFTYPGATISKAGKLKEKVSSGEFSLSTFAFTENKGQVFGYDGLPHAEVKYSFQKGNTQLFLLEKGIAYQFTNIHYPEGYQELVRDKSGLTDIKKIRALQKQIRTETFRMDMCLVGANKNPKITAENESADAVHFYNHNVLNVHSYTKITYHDIYPGIDWIIYLKGKELKYDFLVNPGANPSLIQMEFKHQEKLSLNKDGSFSLKNQLGSITEQAPVSFQEGEKIDTRFVLNKNILSFALGNYSASQALIIDPVLKWATYYGGTDKDLGFSCTTDASGNAYLAGTTLSMANIASGGYQNTYSGNSFYDAFLVKFSSNGARQWATYYGDALGDWGYSCSSDASGNVYLAGVTESTLNISTTGSHQNAYAGGFYDAFLAKFNGAGLRQWATYYGGDGDDLGLFCRGDVSGNIYLSGITSSTSNIALAGHQNSFGGYQDAFLVKFNSNGVRTWGTYYGGLDQDLGFSCTADTSGNVYLAGGAISTNNIFFGGHQNFFGGGQDAFIVKFNSSGVRQWGTYYGDVGVDVAYSCANDNSGNVYLTGYTESNAGISSAGHQLTYGGVKDGFLVKFNTLGLRQWGTYYGGSGADLCSEVSVGGQGVVYISGTTESTNGIATGSVSAFGVGPYDAFLAKFADSGLRLWGSYYGGYNFDDGLSCASDGLGSVYLAGITSSTSNISSSGHQNSLSGNDDAFLVKFCDEFVGPLVINGNTLACSGTTQMYSLALNSGAVSYSWSFSGNPLSSSTNTVSTTLSNNGFVSLVVQNGCGISFTQTLSVIVNPSPVIQLSGTLPFICAGETLTLNASGAVTYTWNTGSNGAVLIQSPTLTTTYSVTGMGTNGCDAVASITQSVDACLGIIPQASSDNSATIYPNPNSGAFILETSQELSISVFNALGQLVSHQTLHAGINKIDLSGQPNGIYFIRCSDFKNAFRLIKD